VLTDARFMLLASALGLGFGGFLIYVASAPDYVFNVLSLNTLQFGWLFIPIVIGLVGGSAISSRMAGKISHTSMVGYGFLLMSGAALFNIVYSGANVVILPWAVLPILLYTLGLALFIPGIAFLALDIFPNNRGMAASIQGVMQSLVFTVVAAFIAPIIFGSAFHYALAMLIMLTLNMACWTGYRTLTTKLNRAQHE